MPGARGASTRRRRPGGLSHYLTAAVFSVGVVWAKPSLACSIDLEPPKFEVIANGGGTVPPPLKLEKVRVRRSKRPPPGPGDCSELGGFALDFKLRDSGSKARDVGIVLKVIGGQLPRDMTLAGGPYVHANGTLNFGFQDYPDEAFSFRLKATAVDALGNQSGPTEVEVTGNPSRSTGSIASRLGCGCSIAGDRGHSDAWGAAFLLGVALLLTRRSNTRAALSEARPHVDPKS